MYIPTFSLVIASVLLSDAEDDDYDEHDVMPPKFGFMSFSEFAEQVHNEQ